MYVPAGWSHQTMNIGEAIGVGAQRVFGGKDKLNVADEALQKSTTAGYLYVDGVDHRVGRG